MTAAVLRTGTGDAADLYRRCAEVFDAIVDRLDPGDLSRPTPCEGWDVRTVLNHVVAEALWLSQLLAGLTIADVGDVFDGDVLGEDPGRSWRAADAGARYAAGAVDQTRPITLSFGTVPAAEYLRQVAADHLIHAWDVARGIDVDLRLPDDVVAEVALWFADAEDGYRSAGAIGPAVSALPTADAQTLLLARFGRRSQPLGTDEVITAFGAAFNGRDLDAIMRWTTPDCVFESTAPPDGVRFEGRAAVRAIWADLFATATDPIFTEESRWVAGDRGVVQWRFDWAGGSPGHVRGVDLFRVSDGLVAEKASYVKG